MTVSAFKPKKNIKFSQIAVYLLGIIGIGLLVFFAGNIIKNIGNIKGKSALSVNTVSGDAEVYLDNVLLGKTPFTSDEISVSEHKVTVKNSDNTYEVTLSFLPNAQVVINRDLGVSPAFSSGQNFWLEESSEAVLSVISSPEGASVYIDNTEVGKTPYSSSSLTAGEYDLLVEKPGYEAQNARIAIQDGHKLNVSLTLFPMPVPSKVDLLEGSASIYNISSNNPIVIADTQQWVEAIIYWNKGKGINIAGLGVNKEPVFDYFVDYKGNVYDATGALLTKDQVLEKKDRGAYLGRATDGAGLSAAAADAVESLGQLALGAKKLVILETGTGWLRVRDQPNLQGAELAKATVGEEFQVLEEGTGWVKIQVSAGVEGWVSSDYVEIQETPVADEPQDTTTEETGTTQDTQDDAVLPN